MNAMDEGEASVIAYAIHHQDSVAVLMDKLPLHEAVEELRGRTLALHGFLDVLVGQHGLAKADADSISRKQLGKKRPPLWW
jgi:hypothetical protein